MKFQTLVCFASVIGLANAAEPVTYDNLPLGSKTSPLILRTFLPDPGLPGDYFFHHGKGGASPKYSPKTGNDVKGFYQPIKGLPSAIGVNHGPALSYAFDTIECRIAYAWQGGFLDMYPYWGDQQRGNRLSFNYVPHLVGILFYQADVTSEIHVDGKPMTDLQDPKYIGYDLKDGVPTFHFSRSGHKFSMTFLPSTDPLSYELTITSPDNIRLSYGNAGNAESTNTLKVTVTGKRIATYQGFPRDSKITEATIANGQVLFESLGCIACHTIDGALSHGPTLAGLFDSDRMIEESDKPVKADAAYLLESIKTPSAKTAKDFPPNYMPPYQLSDPEYDSLVLYIQSIGKGE